VTLLIWLSVILFFGSRLIYFSTTDLAINPYAWICALILITL
jgi:hypothetical protein